MNATTPAGTARREPTPNDFVAMQQDPQFVKLRGTFRSFVFPMSALFFVWYLIYVLLATYAPGFMGKPVWDNINVGIVMGLLQFVTTFAITYIYVNFANKKIEPLASSVRERMEGEG